LRRVITPNGVLFFFFLKFERKNLPIYIHRNPTILGLHRHSEAAILSSYVGVHPRQTLNLLAADYEGVISLWSIYSKVNNITFAAVRLIKTWKASEQEIISSAGHWIGYPKHRFLVQGERSIYFSDAAKLPEPAASFTSLRESFGFFLMQIPFS
jgi:hypothetical protein